MLLLTLALVLCAGDSAVQLTPAEGPASDALVLPEPLPDAEAPVVDDGDRRVKRFLGAMAGSLLGFTATAGLSAFAGTPCPSWCATPGQLGLALLAPFVAAVGAWAGHSLLGGDAGFMTPLVAIVPAVLISLLTALATQMLVMTVGELMPGLAATAAVLSGGMALALEVRSRQLERVAPDSRGDASAARIAATSLLSFVGTGTALLASLLIYQGCLETCGIVAGGVGGLLLAAGVISTWGVHHAMRGRGSVWPALGVGVLAAGLSVGLVASVSRTTFSGGATVVGLDGIVLGVLTSTVLVPLLLEWSHTDVVGSSAPRFSFGAAPTPSGASMSALVRF